MDYGVRCVSCAYQGREETAYKCPVCGGVLEVYYELTGNERFHDDEMPGIFAYHRLLPMLPGMPFASLGEGGTPILKSVAIGRKLGLDRLYFKNDACNPTGSFKDRALALAVNRAKAQGKRDIIVASAGNGSAAAAAYAARLQMRLVALVPESAPASKISQAVTYGARVFKVPGNYSNSFHIAAEAAKRHGFYNVTTTYLNPYAREGFKTVAYELAGEKIPPIDWVVIPIGAGPLLAGMLKGFRDLVKLGLLAKIPRLACVQAERCAPISTAFLAGERVREWDVKQPTIASGIDDALAGYSDEGDYTIRCIRESGGTATTVTENELYESVEMLGRMEGIYAEPAGAVGVCGIRRLLGEQVIHPADTVVSIITGHGLKNPIYAKKEFQAPVVETCEQLLKLL